RLPSHSNEIVFRYESLSAAKVVKNADGTLVNAIQPDDVLITGDNKLYCNVSGDGILRVKQLSRSQVKQLYDQLYLKNGGVQALAARQHAHLPDFTDVMGPATLLINDHAGAISIYNSNDPQNVFGTNVAVLQKLCTQNPPTQKVKTFPNLKNPVLKQTSGAAVSFMEAFGLLGNASAAPTLDSQDETADYNDTNNHRASHVGKGPLYRSGCLTTIARQWAYHMAAAGAISHNPDFAGTGSQADSTCGTNWTSLGENVGEGPSEATIFQAFLDSPCHHSNIDDTSIDYSSSGEACKWSSSGYNMVGIGLYRDDSNILWVVQDFATCYSCSTGKWKTAPTNVYSSSTTTVSGSSTSGNRYPSWKDLGGYMISSPAVASMNANHEEVFATWSNKAVYHKYWTSTSGWSRWYKLGSCSTSAPAAVSWADGRMDVFYHRCNGNLGHFYYTSGSGWAAADLTVSVGWTGGPAVASMNSGRLDVFIRGSNNHLYQKTWNGSWSGYTDRGGTIYSDPAAVSWGAGRIDVFAHGASNHLYHIANSNWSSWQSLGGTITGGPGVASRAKGMLDVYVRGTNNHLYEKSWKGSSWTGFIDHGGHLTSDPDAISRSYSYENVYARQADKTIAYAAWVSGKGWL
ncbi:MAG TPA: CAP domain-containing protein, partial [Candidatus Saccharimonadales bacterium]|nr:CAP domain-containing protein [Candidatus Saccharimonadales bacterium]